MINLYIDFDGVIMNTIEVGYQKIIESGQEINEQTCTEMFCGLIWKDFLNKECSEINNSIQCIQKIIDSDLFNVNILSHVKSL